MKTLLTTIEDQIARNIYHGASLSLYNNGKWSEYYLGTTDGKQAVSPGQIYDLASVSKVVGVGTVLISLIKRGLLEIDSPLSAYYPAFHNKTVTLRQLLTHSSGINPFIPNRNDLNAGQLREAINHIQVGEDKSFFYTDINFLLLGFLLEDYYGESLDQIFYKEIFQPWGMKETGFGPIDQAVPTVAGITDGMVHDPKAKVLGIHAGSAGLFSTIKDLEIFCQNYLRGEFASDIWQNYSLSNRPRSLAWDKEGDWLNHTGYTGPYLAINSKDQKAAIFLTNRTYDYDDRALWIKERRKISQIIQENS